MPLAVMDLSVKKTIEEMKENPLAWEFSQDYASRTLGKEHSPYAKFYRSLINPNKSIMVTSGLPRVSNAGFHIVPSWRTVRKDFICEENCFQATVRDGAVTLIAASDQPSGVKQGETVTWKPDLYLDGVKQRAGKVKLLDTDPVNRNYHYNILEWDYGFCKRRIRIIEGRFRERWVFETNPGRDVRIKHNFIGNLPIKLGSSQQGVPSPLNVIVIGNEEFISASELAQAIYPVEIGASLTAYPDAGSGNTTVDGITRYNIANGTTWSDVVTHTGDFADDTGTTLYGTNIQADDVEPKWNYNHRINILLDTSGLGATAIISNGVLSFYGTAKEDNLSIAPDANIYASNPASNNALIAADYLYTAYGNTAFSTAITYANWKVADPFWNDFTLNPSGLAAISKTGITKLAWRNANYDVAEELDSGNHTPTWSAPSPRYSYFASYSADQGVGFKPQLVVTYTVGWTNIASLRQGTGEIASADMANIRMGTGSIAVADIAKIGGVAV